MLKCIMHDHISKHGRGSAEITSELSYQVDTWLNGLDEHSSFMPGPVTIGMGKCQLTDKTSHYITNRLTLQDR